MQRLRADPMLHWPQLQRGPASAYPILAGSWFIRAYPNGVRPALALVLCCVCTPVTRPDVRSGRGCRRPGSWTSEGAEGKGPFLAVGLRHVRDRILNWSGVESDGWMGFRRADGSRCCCVRPQRWCTGTYGKRGMGGCSKKSGYPCGDYWWKWACCNAAGSVCVRCWEDCRLPRLLVFFFWVTGECRQAAAAAEARSEEEWSSPRRAFSGDARRCSAKRLWSGSTRFHGERWSGDCGGFVAVCRRNLGSLQLIALQRPCQAVRARLAGSGSAGESGNLAAALMQRSIPRRTEQALSRHCPDTVRTVQALSAPSAPSIHCPTAVIAPWPADPY